MIAVLLVDDERVIRKGLRMRLAAEPGIAVIGEASDGASALALARSLLPDVVVMDVEMPRMDGIAAAERLRHECPSTSVVLLSFSDDAQTQARAKAAGAAALIVKRSVNDKLMTAIRQAAGQSTTQL